MAGQLTCLGCQFIKKDKKEKFYDTNNFGLLKINYLRSGGNSRKRQLEVLESLPSASKICKLCYNRLRRKAIEDHPDEDHNEQNLDTDFVTGQPIETNNEHNLDPNFNAHHPSERNNEDNLDPDLNADQHVEDNNILDFEPDLRFYRKGWNSHHRCTFGCRNRDRLVCVPKTLKRLLLMEYKFLTFPDARLCSDHLQLENYWPLVKQISTEVSANEQVDVSNLMFEYYHDNRKTVQSPFDIEKIDLIDDKVFKSWFGYHKDQFKTICEFTKDCKPTHVAIILCKMRTALSNEQLSFLFGCCTQTISNHLASARNDLLINFVPYYLNWNDRETMLSHNTSIAKKLFEIPDDRAAIIFDGGYRLTQKSKNFAGQKQMWSEQKKMPLVKPMVGCAPDGYILFVFGPYDATHNDAVIMRDCFDRYEEEMNSIHQGDFFIVDRGFRDVVPYLQEKHLNAFTPGHDGQEELAANKARFTTKIRWIIEQVFGRLKSKFKLFSIPAHNATLSDDFDRLLIGFALLNLFHKPIISDWGVEDVAEKMLSRLNVPNKLKNVVEDYNLTKVRTPYDDINYELIDNAENNRQLQFPELTYEDLRNISLGSYQINNAASYYAQHKQDELFFVQKFNPNRRHATATLDYANYNINVVDPLLIKAYMKSRYRSGKHHHIFVLVDKSKAGRDCIVEYYCTCETGIRTVGCCSHVMTIIWYLGYAQYRHIHTPNPNICNVSITVPRENS